MKELTLTQQYILCTWKQDGKFPVFGREKLVCFSAAGVLELLLAGVLALDGKTLTVQSALPETRAFLRPVYDLVQAKQPVKWETVVKYFSASFTGKRIQAWLHLVGDSLAQEGCVQKTTGGFLGRACLYRPHPAAVDQVVGRIRAELLEAGTLSEEMVALTALLNTSGDLRRYFSDSEKTALKKRLAQIRENPQNQMIQKALAYMQALLVPTIVAIS